MARASQEAIDTFISITGASDAIALQKLEEHGGDLNEAVNSYFNEGDRNIVRPAPVSVPEDDFMAIDDDPIRNVNPYSLLNPDFLNPFLEGRGRSEFSSARPWVTHPREVREIPIEFKDENGQSSRSGPSGPRPAIEDVTGTAYTGPDIRGNVIIDDEDDEILPTAAPAHPSAPSAPGLDNVTHYSNDIEEEMIQAAIEASKREVLDGFPNQQFGAATDDSSGPASQQRESHGEDTELERAVSLSLKTAEQEAALRIAEKDGLIPSEVEELGRVTALNGRQGFGSLSDRTPIQPKMEVGSSSLLDEGEDTEEQPLVRQRSRRVSSGSDSAKESSELEDSSPSSPRPHESGSHPQPNGNAFPSNEWGGISSQEHDEAVMLEAAIFGGISDATAYPFGYPPQQSMQTGPNRGFYPQPVPRPPSPTLTAQRLLREQQDDEYLASLQADREKELKAMEEAEARRLVEQAAREADLEEERKREEESQRKLQEEEEIERQLAAKEASLPREPAVDDENSVNLLVRMPDGGRRGRRFLKFDKLQSLFDFIDVGRGGVKPGTYRLVRPYPRRAFSDSESKLSLSDLGLTSKQEALFLELI